MAAFAANNDLVVMTSGTGSGVVTSSPAGIDCGADCSEAYPPGSIVTLTAAPAMGSTFEGWLGGGCSGMSYELGWEDQQQADDNVVDAQGIKVYIDRMSAPYLQGSEIDFVQNDMMGAGFAIKNPNVKSSCGCGQSFS